MQPRLYQTIKNHGFRLPREHGLTVIWTGAISLGIGITMMKEFDIFGLILSLLFAVSILFSADSLMRLAKHQRRNIQWLPILSILVTAGIMLLWVLRVELVSILIIIGTVSVGWIFFSFQSKQVNPMELAMGSVSIGLLAVVIYLSSVQNFASVSLQQVSTIVWAFIGVAIAHIQYVETLRNKLAIKVFFLTWLFFLGTLLIPMSLSVVTFLIYLPMIEPTLFILLQTYQKKLLKNSERKIKTIGFQLMFRLWIAVFLMLTFFPLIINS